MLMSMWICTINWHLNKNKKGRGWEGEARVKELQIININFEHHCVPKFIIYPKIILFFFFLEIAK